jgi:hypothetical protein
MRRATARQRIGRLGVYIIAMGVVAVVWLFEFYMQHRTQLYGSLIEKLNPLQEKQLAAFLEMNRLLITLGTTLLGAMGFLLTGERKAESSRRELRAAFGSALCVGLSLYFGYRAYEDIILMLQAPATFDLTGFLISWDRYAHFCTFLFGVFFFVDFAFHEMIKENRHEDVENA